MILQAYSFERWCRYLDVLYKNDMLESLISDWIQFQNDDEILKNAFYYSNVVFFLEEKGEYKAAIDLAWIIEGELANLLGSFHYTITSIYANLLELYTKNGQFDFAELIARHLMFIVQENKKWPMPPLFLRNNIAEPLMRCGIVSGKHIYCKAAEAFLKIAEQMDGLNFIVRSENFVKSYAIANNNLNLDLINYCCAVYFVVGSLVQPDDNTHIIDNGDIRMSMNEYLDEYVHSIPFHLHNRRGMIRIGGTEKNLERSEYCFFLDRQRHYYVSCRYKCGIPERFQKNGYLVIQRRNNLFQLYLKISELVPRWNGIAYGENDGQYLIYRFNDICKLDEGAFLFWTLSNGIRTVKDICMYISGLFQNADEMKIFKETAESALELYEMGLIWFDLI